MKSVFDGYFEGLAEFQFVDGIKCLEFCKNIILPKIVMKNNKRIFKNSYQCAKSH